MIELAEVASAGIVAAAAAAAGSETAAGPGAAAGSGAAMVGSEVEEEDSEDGTTLAVEVEVEASGTIFQVLHKSTTHISTGVVAVAASVTTEGVVSTTTNPMGMVLLLDLGVRLQVLDMGQELAEEVGIAVISSARDHLVGTMTEKRNGQGIEGISGFLVRSFRFHAKVSVCFRVEYIWWVQVCAVVPSVVQSCAGYVSVYG